MVNSTSISIGSSISQSIQQILQGIKLISNGIYNLLFIPLNLLGITVPGAIAQIIYLTIFLYIIYILVKSWKVALIIFGILIFLSIPSAIPTIVSFLK